MYQIENEVFIKISSKIKSHLTSVIIQKDLKYYDNANNLVICKMKDETSGVPIKGFVWLKHKMYTYIAEDSPEYN